MFARRFEDKTERIEAIRDFVPQTISVGIDYADKDNPVIRLYNEGEDKPFAQGNVGDYVVNDNGTFCIVKLGEITAEMLMAQKMKKKHLRAVQIAIFFVGLVLMAVITAPISLLGMIGEGLKWLWYYAVLRPVDWYNNKFIINDYDPD